MKIRELFQLCMISGAFVSVLCYNYPSYIPEPDVQVCLSFAKERPYIPLGPLTDKATYLAEKFGTRTNIDAFFEKPPNIKPVAESFQEALCADSELKPQLQCNLNCKGSVGKQVRLGIVKCGEEYWSDPSWKDMPCKVAYSREWPSKWRVVERPRSFLENLLFWTIEGTPFEADLLDMSVNPYITDNESTPKDLEYEGKVMLGVLDDVKSMIRMGAFQLKDMERKAEKVGQISEPVGPIAAITRETEYYIQRNITMGVDPEECVKDFDLFLKLFIYRNGNFEVEWGGRLQQRKQELIQLQLAQYQNLEDGNVYANAYQSPSPSGDYPTAEAPTATPTPTPPS